MVKGSTWGVVKLRDCMAVPSKVEDSRGGRGEVSDPDGRLFSGSVVLSLGDFASLGMPGKVRRCKERVCYGHLVSRA